jgi:hypothetical protein
MRDQEKVAKPRHRRRSGVVKQFLATPPRPLLQRRLRCFFFMSRPPLLLLRRRESVIVSVSYEATRLPPSRGHERSRTISTPYDIQHPF